MMIGSLKKQANPIFNMELLRDADKTIEEEEKNPNDDVRQQTEEIYEDDIEVDSLSNSTSRSRNSSTNVDELEDQTTTVTTTAAVSASASASAAAVAAAVELTKTYESIVSSSESFQAYESDAVKPPADSHSNLSIESSTAKEDMAKEEMAEEKAQVEEEEEFDDIYYEEQQAPPSIIKRTHLRNIVYELYNLDSELRHEEARAESGEASTPIEGYVEKLPPGKTYKNSLLLTWKRRYATLNSIGLLYVHDLDERTMMPRAQPDEIYNLMGGRVEYDADKVISLDDRRGNIIVLRVVTNAKNNSSNGNGENRSLFDEWKSAIDSQIVDRVDKLWVRPNNPLNVNAMNPLAQVKQSSAEPKKVIILDIGTCSMRAGLFDKERKLIAFYNNIARIFFGLQINYD